MVIQPRSGSGFLVKVETWVSLSCRGDAGGTAGRGGGVKSRQKVGEQGCLPVSVSHAGVCPGAGPRAGERGGRGDEPGRESFPETRRALDEAGGGGAGGARAGVGGGAWVSFPDEVRGPGCEHRKWGWVGVLERSLEVIIEAPYYFKGVRWSVHVGHGQ